MTTYSFTVNADLHITSWDRESEMVTGKNFAEVCGKSYEEILPVLNDHHLMHELEAAVHKGVSACLSGFKVSCFYGAVDARVKVSPLIDTDGGREGARIAVELIPLCTMAKKLQHAQPLIDIGTTASTLAHGVRNPLNAIKGAVVYIKDSYAHEKTLVEFATIIEEEISRLDTFIMKFLSSSIVETELVETDINGLLRKIETYVTFQTKAQSIERTFVYGMVPAILIDSFQIEQAVLNVINNAMAALAEGGSITVRTFPVQRQGNPYVAIQVTDTGPGITPDKIRQSSSLSGERISTNGKGFGLFITREIIQFHGGHLEYKSEKNAGTTVTFYLPAVCRKQSQ